MIRRRNHLGSNESDRERGSNPMKPFAALLGMFATIAALLALPAVSIAAPVLGVELSRSPTNVNRGDERVDYRLEVRNEAGAAPAPGDTLTCDANSSKWFQEPAFSFRWLSGGEEAEGPISTPTSTSSTYVIQPSDAGRALQCEVRGSNAAGAAVSLSLPLVVDPAPGPPPPSYSGSGNPRPLVAPATAGPAERTCTPPTSWDPGTTWTFQWLRNGVPIPGAIGSTYLPKAGSGEADELKVLQCVAIGSSGSATPPSGGRIATASNTILTAPAASFDAPFGKRPPNNNATVAASGPPVGFSNTTFGAVTVDLALPGGDETFVYEAGGPGWSCSSTPTTPSSHARATCTRSDALGPQASYPPLAVAAALGADVPDTSLAVASASGGGAATGAEDADVLSLGPATPFGIADFAVAVEDAAGGDFTQAGGHPNLVGTAFAVTTHRRLAVAGEWNEVGPTENVRSAFVDVPRGFAGNATAPTQLCPSMEMVVSTPSTCPPGSVVGGVYARFVSIALDGVPIYAMEPERGAIAQFAFGDAAASKGVYPFVARLRPDDGYAIRFESAPIVESPQLVSVNPILCGFGAKTVVGPGDTTMFDGCREAGEAGAFSEPLITNPTRCEAVPPTTRLRLDSWLQPGRFATETTQAAALTGCDSVEFEPELEVEPSSASADSPTGLSVALSMPTEGMVEPGGVAQANLRGARVTLPAGMAVNPSAATGLGACTRDEIGLGTDDPVSCPPASKIGTVEVETPVLAEKLTGSVYLAAQRDNPFDSTLGLYLAFGSSERGVLIKVAGKVVADPVTGQLTSVFTDAPEAPFSRLELRLRAGDRAPLINPPRCGEYRVEAEFAPWNAADPEHPTDAELVRTSVPYRVESGPGGGPCPGGALAPRLGGGLEDPTAGSSSPLVLELSRDDGSQRLVGIDVDLPAGLSADLSGIPYCPEQALASISAAELAGAVELAGPACPLASRVGSVTASVGAGPVPFEVRTGSAYLAGPYRGAPLSLAIVMPAVAGPLDLGSVVVRTALRVDPTTARVTAVSDPLPTILHGLLLDVREVRVELDRPGFTRAPTSCERSSIWATVRGEAGGAAVVDAPFQVDGCGALGFAPKLSLRLSGRTKRSAHASLRTVVKAVPGDANIGRASVILPPSQMIDNARIGEVCTRSQFAADACPPSSVLGWATAETPLLDAPLTGPVYLRANGGERDLPDVVADLSGQVDVVVAGYVDAVTKKRGAVSRIRTTFATLPDVPVSRFSLTLNGGRRGLLVNSRNLCAYRYRATVRVVGANGKPFVTRPAIGNDCRRKASASPKRANARGGKAGQWPARVLVKRLSRPAP